MPRSAHTIAGVIRLTLAQESTARKSVMARSLPRLEFTRGARERMALTHAFLSVSPTRIRSDSNNGSMCVESRTTGSGSAASRMECRTRAAAPGSAFALSAKSAASPGLNEYARQPSRVSEPGTCSVMTQSSVRAPARRSCATGSNCGGHMVAGAALRK